MPVDRLWQLRAAFEALDDTAPWMRGLAGERCLTVEAFRVAATRRRLDRNILKE